MKNVENRVFELLLPFAKLLSERLPSLQFFTTASHGPAVQNTPRLSFALQPKIGPLEVVGFVGIIESVVAVEPLDVVDIVELVVGAIEVVVVVASAIVVVEVGVLELTIRVLELAI